VRNKESFSMSLTVEPSLGRIVSGSSLRHGPPSVIGCECFLV
jgi:hypothetical protein